MAALSEEALGSALGAAATTFTAAGSAASRQTRQRQVAAILRRRSSATGKPDALRGRLPAKASAFWHQSGSVLRARRSRHELAARV